MPWNFMKCVLHFRITNIEAQFKLLYYKFSFLKGLCFVTIIPFVQIKQKYEIRKHVLAYWMLFGDFVFNRTRQELIKTAWWSVDSYVEIWELKTCSVWTLCFVTAIMAVFSLFWRLCSVCQTVDAGAMRNVGFGTICAICNMPIHYFCVICSLCNVYLLPLPMVAVVPISHLGAMSPCPQALLEHVHLHIWEWPIQCNYRG